MHYSGLTFRHLSFATLLAVLPFASIANGSASSPVGHHSSSNVDRQAIGQLLESYTQSVSSGDRLRFESLLLQLDIPFFAVVGLSKSSDATVVETRNYRSFRAAVFDSGKHFHQRFFYIRIGQDADLAQVSLDFVTTEDATGDSGYSWKSCTC